MKRPFPKTQEQLWCEEVQQRTEGRPLPPNVAAILPRLVCLLCNEHQHNSLADPVLRHWLDDLDTLHKWMEEQPQETTP